MSAPAIAVIVLVALAHLVAFVSIAGPLVGRKLKGGLPSDVSQILR